MTKRSGRTKVGVLAVALALAACGSEEAADRPPGGEPEADMIGQEQPDPMGPDMSTSTPDPTPEDMGSDPAPMPDMDTSPPDMRQAPEPDMSSSGADMAGAPDQGMSGQDMGGSGGMCGDGALDPGEECDGDCPSSCDDGEACTVDTMMGSAATCDLVCMHDSSASSCGIDDGCCPMGCTLDQDVDCAPDASKPWTWPSMWAQLEDQMIVEVNNRRAQGGTCGQMSFASSSPIQVVPSLREAARVHSLDMATRDYFGSASPEGDRIGDRASAVGYAYLTISQLIGVKEAAAAQVNQWMGDEGNCARILDPKYTEGAAGYAYGGGSMYETYWALVIAEPQ